MLWKNSCSLYSKLTFQVRGLLACTLNHCLDTHHLLMTLFHTIFLSSEQFIMRPLLQENLWWPKCPRGHLPKGNYNFFQTAMLVVCRSPKASTSDNLPIIRTVHYRATARGRLVQSQMSQKHVLQLQPTRFRTIYVPGHQCLTLAQTHQSGNGNFKKLLKQSRLLFFTLVALLYYMHAYCLRIETRLSDNV